MPDVIPTGQKKKNRSQLTEMNKAAKLYKTKIGDIEQKEK